MAVTWWQFYLPDTQGNLDISTPTAQQTLISIPKDAKPGEKYHVILEASDTGSPALTSYQRVILSVRER